MIGRIRGLKGGGGSRMGCCREVVVWTCWEVERDGAAECSELGESLGWEFRPVGGVEKKEGYTLA